MLLRMIVLGKNPVCSYTGTVMEKHVVVHGMQVTQLLLFARSESMTNMEVGDSYPSSLGGSMVFNSPTL